MTAGSGRSGIIQLSEFSSLGYGRRQTVGVR